MSADHHQFSPHPSSPRHSLLSLASVTLGFISVLSCICCSTYVTIPLAILFGGIALYTFNPHVHTPQSKTLAKAGIGLGVGAIVLAVVVQVVLGVGAMGMKAFNERHEDRAQEQPYTSPHTLTHTPSSPSARAQGAQKSLARANAMLKEMEARDAAKKEKEKMVRNMARRSRHIKARKAKQKQSARASKKRKPSSKRRRKSARRRSPGYIYPQPTRVEEYNPSGWNHVSYQY